MKEFADARAQILKFYNSLEKIVYIKFNITLNIHESPNDHSKNCINIFESLIKLVGEAAYAFTFDEFKTALANFKDWLNSSVTINNIIESIKHADSYKGQKDSTLEEKRSLELLEVFIKEVMPVSIETLSKTDTAVVQYFFNIPEIFSNKNDMNKERKTLLIRFKDLHETLEKKHNELISLGQNFSLDIEKWIESRGRSDKISFTQLTLGVKYLDGWLIRVNSQLLTLKK